MLARTFILALAGGAIAAGCSRSEPPPSKPPSPKVAAAPAASAPVNPGDIDEGLKERLARQEAAARMFESKVLNPPAPKVPEPPAALKTATPPSPAQPSAPAQPAAAAATAPPPPAVTRTEPRGEPPRVAARAESPKAAAPAPRTDLAAVRPPVAPEAPAAKLVTRVDPDFPREAIQAGVEQGNVRARMTLDASGAVTRVEILEAQPRRVFDRAVVRALSQWRYSEGATGRMVDMEVAFRR